MSSAHLHFKSFPKFDSSTQSEFLTIPELKNIILYEDDNLLVINKPGWIVCHPSKNGPFSSLIGAARQYTGLDTLHPINRLDRETSGLILIAKNHTTASIFQTAIEKRLVSKNYLTILSGHLSSPLNLSTYLEKHPTSIINARVAVSNNQNSKIAITNIYPLISNNGYTFARVEIQTGRKHQIRAHAHYSGFPVVGDKIYGPDESLFLEFIEHGWTPRLESSLPMRRQALHSFQISFHSIENYPNTFVAPLFWDIQQFLIEVMHLSLEDIQSAIIL